MSKNKHENLSDSYLPLARTGYAPEAHSLESCSPTGFNSKLPSLVKDDIAVNNITTQEFDYTEQNYIDSELDTNA